MIIVYLIIFLIQLNYLLFMLFVLFGLRKVKSKNGLTNEYPFVTIIIPLRNESHNVDKLLNNLRDINYPESCYEIIVIDDHSTDDTVEKVKPYLRNNLRLISNDNVENSFKKTAIEKAIKNSAGEIIVLTDADCIHSSSWITSLIKCFDKNIAMVVGPVRFACSNSLFDKIQQLEFAGLMLTAAGLIGIGKPKICSSANLAFRKKVFEKVNGYKDNKHLSSGDDELLLQKISKLKEYKINFCWDKDAVVITESNGDIKKFFQQRRRWASKSLFYESKLFIAFLVLVFMFYLSFFLLPILSLINPLFVIFLLFSILIKLVFEYLIMKEGKDFLFDKSNLKYFLIAEILQVPYIIISSILGIIGNYSWKGRKVGR